MNGQTDSLNETTKQQLATFEKHLDDYLTKIGLFNNSYNPVEIKDILNLNFEQICKLSEEECGGKAFVLTRFSLYIKQEQNRQNVRVNWARENINRLLSKYGSKYGDSYVKHEMKLASLCNEDSAAKALNQIIIHAGARSTELENIAEHINLISKSLNDNRQTKRKFYGDPARTN